MTGVVGAGVATLWRSPEAPRALDEAALRDRPDVAAWLAALDASGPGGRLGLHGRVDTQLLRGEPVVVLERREGWSRVAAPWQPSSEHPEGYPGWVRTAHLDLDGTAPDAPTATEPPGVPALDVARRFLGLRYLWGGTSDAGVDCSGLVHRSWRALGTVLPRDAHDQATAVRPVPLAEVRPGDLYFFARPGAKVYHVGFVTRPVADDGTRWMLHAPETGDPYVEDAPLAPHRRDTLVSAGRVEVP
ncbi:MAG: C40 family peptidase [Nocardioidaceae bacterium]|nr:C40 family peptidase [Nocardioidaceae bacterium]